MRKPIAQDLIKYIEKEQFISLVKREVSELYFPWSIAQPITKFERASKIICVIARNTKIRNILMALTEIMIDCNWDIIDIPKEDYNIDTLITSLIERGKSIESSQYRMHENPKVTNTLAYKDVWTADRIISELGKF